MNEVSLVDVKLKMGELVLENMVLQKEIARLRAELEELIGDKGDFANREKRVLAQNNFSD